MEKSVKKPFFLSQAEKEKSSSSNDDSSSIGKKSTAQDKKEVNSWDCSTPSNNGNLSKRKPGDWESNSVCQETMVEPFDSNEIPKDCDNWDSESDNDHKKSNLTCDKVARQCFLNAEDSCDLSLGNFSNVDKSTSDDLSGSDKGKVQEEDYLLLEDFDEFVKDDNAQKSIKLEELNESPGCSDLGTGNEKVRSKQSEGTPEDTTIWMIPKSERTQSGESTSRLISSSEKVKIEKLNQFNKLFKKSKSLSDVGKSKIRRSARSEYLGYQKNNYNNFLLCEGSVLQRKLEIDNGKENIAGCEGFDRTRVFFTEYECRAMTMDKDAPDKLFATSVSEFSAADEIFPESVFGELNEYPSLNPVEGNDNATVEAAVSEIVRPGPSGINTLDVLSLPDMTGKNSIKERQKEKNCSRSDGERLEPKPQTEPDKRTQIGESWLLLDDTGHYQAVTRNEVSILLNGRSAEAVLQGRKQHFISNLSLKDTGSLKNSLSCILAKESLNFLREEDMGGEDDRNNALELERKMENTLFFIQPGTDLTASIRIIPLDTEMIHLWRRTKDGGSVLSSEVDLLNPSQDSVVTVNPRIPVGPQPSVIHLLHVGQNLRERDENQSSKISTVNGPTDVSLPPIQVKEPIEYRKLLFETRNIVDSLTNNFQNLQNRLEGETNRSLALQVEMNKLRLLLKKHGWKFQDINSRETVADPGPSLDSSLSILTMGTVGNADSKSENIADIVTEDFEGPKANSSFIVQDRKTAVERLRCLATQSDVDEFNVKEGNDVITVNIYTVDSFAPIPSMKGKPQEMYSIVNSNLRLIENKMKRLQQENEFMLKQNMELKKKLNEISVELEKYLAGTSEQDPSNEESRNSETPRDQVCNLKLELENLKTLMRNEKEQLAEENSFINEKFTKSLFSLKDWCTMAEEVFQKILTAKNKMHETGITVDINLEPDLFQDPKIFSKALVCYIEQTAQYITTIKNENFLLEQSLKEDIQRQTSKEISGLDQVISGYSELIDQCRKGQTDGVPETKVMEDYFAVIMEKASLVEEVKILKTENEMLLESQLQHYEKLKETMIALKDRKNEITALESTRKLSEEERSKMTEVLKLYEEEKKKMEKEIAEKSRTIENLKQENKRKDMEFNDSNDRLKMALNEIKNFEKSSQIKDELISKLEMENNELSASEEMKSNQIEMLEHEIKNLEIQRTQLEAELISSKTFVNESQNEMRDYITHLEALVNDSQESMDKLKQKLKENSQIINRLKSENDILDKQHQCDVKLFNNTKDELNSCKEKLTKVSNKLKEAEEEREKLEKKCEIVACSEKEKSDSLEILTKEFKTVFDENVELREKVEIFSKDKDETLKEQKDLINKYSMLSKEIQKLQEKYRSVKSECNQRSDLIRYLEMMLKENVVEYSNRIACLEQNISRIIEKIVACKNGMREKHYGVDPEVRELRQQLDITYQERRELEKIVNNYQSAMKRLENEIRQRENKVDELHVKLTLEQQKAMEYENERRSFQLPEPPKNSEQLKVEQLESQLAAAERELGECKRELQLCQTNYENDKKKLELTIADLKSEIKRYQLRIEVIMRNLSNCNRNMNGLLVDKRNTENTEIEALKKELQEKNKTIAELNDTIRNFKAEVKLKDSNLENFNKKSFYHDEELKNLQNQIAKMRECTNALQQKEKDEMAEKLFQSIKLIMDERSARQALESAAMQKEKQFKEQMDKIRNELLLKIKECEGATQALEDKKKLVNKLQDDLKKMKADVVSLKRQVDSCKKKCHQGNGDCGRKEENESPTRTTKTQNVSQERLESSLKELKDIRDLNLQLRKAEGQYQAKIVLLEDEIRGARLLIKELQGDIKTEKKSKKALKNMILAAKMEIEKCLSAKQLMSVVAEKISRHLDLSDIPSRELLSGFRLSDS